MDTNKEIEAAFARANVPLRITNRSLNRNIIRGARDIVQMDIGRDNKGNETIRMNIPDGGDVRVLGGDPNHQQVVVMIHEPDQTFTEKVWNHETGKVETKTRRTPGGNRRFLVGMDECHLFIAQLTTNCTTVKQAHEGLRPRTLPKGREAKRQKIRRTGEWFLIPATPEELARIEEHVKKFGVKKNVGIGGNRMGRGRPHVVSESVIVGRKTEPQPPTRWGNWIAPAVVRDGEEFVRGRIVHPDHKVVKLTTWHRVTMNTEDRSAGSRWVD